nr:MAG TPA: hypothetical protein [Herelleviridae sp.]
MFIILCPIYRAQDDKQTENIDKHRRIARRLPAFLCCRNTRCGGASIGVYNI